MANFVHSAIYIIALQPAVYVKYTGGAFGIMASHDTTTYDTQQGTNDIHVLIVTTVQYDHIMWFVC